MTININKIEIEAGLEGFVLKKRSQRVRNPSSSKGHFSVL